MRIKKNFFKKMACLVSVGMLSLMTFLTACGGKAGGGRKEELPSDTPWNHGPYAIMETESGWYTSHATQTYLCLRYYEKESGNTILLCNKPECLHEGDDGCEATYRSINVINTVLYEGSIYVYGVQGKDGTLGGREDSPTTDTVSLCLWRAALDGSSIDMVGTVIEAENSQAQKVDCPRGVYSGARFDNSFIIHQGYAYVPYYLQFGTGQIGFQGGGIKKVELATGNMEDVYKMDGRVNGVPSGLTVVGDKLYYLRYATNSTRWLPLYCYSITEKTLEPLELTWSTPEMTFGGKKHAMLYNARVAFTKDRIYGLGHTYQEDMDENGSLAIIAFDAETGMMVEEECVDTELSYVKRKERLSYRQGSYYDVMPSPNGLLLSDGDGAYFYDLSGKKTGEMALPKEMLGIGDRDKNLIMDYLISDGKLYLNFGGAGAFFRVLCVPLEDVSQGKGEWKEAYKIQEKITYLQYEDIINGGGILLKEE